MRNMRSKYGKALAMHMAYSVSKWAVATVYHKRQVAQLQHMLAASAAYYAGGN